MKKNITIVVLVLIIIAGGIFYYFKYNFIPKERLMPIDVVTQINEKDPAQNIPTNNVVSDCLPTTAPWIKVLSPNGGETFTAGQQIDVKWKSCNMSTTSVGVTLAGYPYPTNGIQFFPGKWIHSSLGSEKITIPTNAPESKYIVNISTPGGESPYQAEDSSDNPFTINPLLSTALPAYISAQSGWPPVIQDSSDEYSCVPTTSEMTKIIQKFINNKVYCVTKFTEGAAGSSYSTYTYKTPFGISNNTKTTTFTLKYVSCGVYGGLGNTQYEQCKKNQTDFNIDAIVDSLM